MNNQPNPPTDQQVPAPMDPPDSGTLPHALVFFLTREQRKLALRALQAIHESREVSLLRALGVDPV